MEWLFFIKNKEKIYIVLIFIIVLLLGIGYASLNSELSMQGKIDVRVKQDIRVTNYYLKSTTNGANELNSEYKKKSIMTNISLPNIDSTIAYQGEITNIGTFAMVLDSINDLVGDNENIVYDISLKVGDLFYGNGEKYTFTVTFKYKDGLTEVPENTELNSTIEFEFKKKESVLAKGSNSTTVVFNKQLDKSKIESIEFLDYIEPSYDVVDKWDASDKNDGSVMAWTVLDEDTQLYKLYVGGINGVVANTDSSYAFYKFSEANSILFNGNYDTKYTITMKNMLAGCVTLKELDVSSFDTSNVTDMSYMFNGLKVLISLNITNFNTSSVVDMQSMFKSCEVLSELNLSNFDTSNVVSMYEMFCNCYKLESINVSNFKTNKLKSLYNTFGNCKSLKKLDLSNFDTSNVTSMGFMFVNCSSLMDLNLDGFNTENVSNMAAMFANMSSITKLNLSSFTIKNTVNISQMFQNCSKLELLDMRKFAFENSTYSLNPFYGISENINIIVKSEVSKEFVSKLNSTATITVAQ